MGGIEPAYDWGKIAYAPGDRPVDLVEIGENKEVL